MKEKTKLAVFFVTVFRNSDSQRAVLDDIEYRHLDLKGIKIRPNTLIGSAISIDDLFRDGYKSIFVGTGVWKPNSLHIKG